MEAQRSQNHDPFKPERVGHPEKLNQSLGVDVPEWYHPNWMRRQEEKLRKGAPAARNDPVDYVDPTGMYLVGLPNTPGGAPGPANGGGFNPFDPTGSGSVWSGALNGSVYNVVQYNFSGEGEASITYLGVEGFILGFWPGGGGGGGGTAPGGKPCPPEPPSPPGVSALANAKSLLAMGMSSNGVISVQTTFWNNIQDNGLWDYKVRFGNSPENDYFGNFNFGAVGTAINTPSQALLVGAGLKKYIGLLVQGKLPVSLPWNGYPYGNQQNKEDAIQDGINYWNAIANGCYKLVKI
jgi:Bacterial toxin 44